MKKLWISTLAMLMCFSCFAACNSKNEPSNSEGSSIESGASTSDGSESGSDESDGSDDSGDDSGSEDGYDLDGAKKYLKSLYRNSPSETSTDYTVLNVITVNDVDYTITWSVNVSTGVVVEKGETETLINVDEMVKADVEYILTATIADPDGNTTDVLFNRTVKALSSEVYAPITAAPVEGTAYKFQVFQGTNQQYLYLNGKMKNIYYFDTATTAEEGLDLLVENTEGGFHLYYMNGEVKTYINVIKSGTHINGKYHTEEDMANGNDDAPSTPTVYTFSEELGTIVTSLDDKVFYFGCDGDYNTIEPQSETGSTFYKGYLVTMSSRDEVSDEKKVQEEINLLNVPSLHYVASGEIQGLAALGSTYPDVAITWAVEGEGAVLSNNNLTLTAGSSISTVTLTATLKVNEVETTKSFEITLIPNTEAAILEAAFGLEKGEAFANEVELTGVITTVDEAYDAIDHKNITVTMKVQDKYIKCYRLAGNGAEEIKEGYTITVSGIIKNYNGTVQFDQGCYLASYVSGEAEELQESTIPEALLLADGAPVKVSGTVSKINTAWDSSYGNITVTIVDAEGNELYIYRLKTNVNVGDIITIKGSMASHNGNKQVGAGATAEITGHDSKFDYKEMTISEALAADDGQNVIVSGTVTKVNAAWSDQYKNMEITISDADGNELYVYRIATQVELGDIITVKGTMDTYKSARQIAQGATATITGHDDTVVTPPAGGDNEGGDNEGGDNEGGDNEGGNTEESTADFKFTVDNLNIPSQQYCTTETTATVNGIEFAFIQIGNYGNGLQWRTKEGVSGALWNTTALSGNLTKIVFTPNQTASKDYQNEYVLALGNTTACDEKTVDFKTDGKNTFTVTVEGDYKFFKITHANGYSQYFDSIEIYCEEAAPTYTVSVITGNPRLDPTCVETLTFKEGETISLETPTAEGKTFAGWIDVDGNAITDWTAKADTAIYATWDVTPYTVTIKKADGSTESFTFGVEAVEGIIDCPVESVAWNLADYLSDGYTWAESIPETFELKDYAFTEISVEVPKYTLTLRNGNPRTGGTAESFEYAEGAALELSALEAEGKNFLGWYSMDDNGDPTVSAPTTMPAETLVLYAVWEVIPYTVTITKADGSTESFTFGVETVNGIDCSVESVAWNLANYLPENTAEYTYAWAESIPAEFALQNYSFTVKVEVTVTTIEAALAAANGTKAKFSGTVYGIYAAWDEEYDNMSFYVTDGKNTILVFRAGAKVGIGDTVEVNGVVSEYYGTNQIAQGSTVTVTAVHTCSTFTEATCLDAPACTVCGTVSGSALGHTTESGICERCNKTIGEGAVESQYVKVTSASDFTTGSYVLVVNTKNVTLSTVDGTWLKGTTLSSVGETISKTEGDTLAITLEVSNDGVKIKIGTQYVKPKGGNNNGISVGDYTWAYEFQDDGTIVFKGKGSDTATLAYNIQSSGFRAYKNATVTGSQSASYPCKFTAYKLAD